MHSINPETVYALTPQGHDVMQNRSIQLPIELRFLMMLINGERSVQTLRLVSPAAKYDDAGFVILMEYGLIDDVDQAARAGHSEVPLFFDAQSDVLAAVEPAQANRPAVTEIETPIAFSSTEVDAHYGNEAEIISEPMAEPSHHSETAAYATEIPQTNMPEVRDDIDHDYVSDDDRRFVEDVLKRALKDDAKFAIDQLRQKTHYSEFASSVVRLEKALRDNISGIEADTLRKHFSRVFS
jgi:hypothetical protein